jgi:hypothetical protein
MKGDVKRKSFSADWSGKFGLASSPPELNTIIVAAGQALSFPPVGHASEGYPAR